MIHDKEFIFQKRESRIDENIFYLNRNGSVITLVDRWPSDFVLASSVRAYVPARSGDLFDCSPHRLLSSAVRRSRDHSIRPQVPLQCLYFRAFSDTGRKLGDWHLKYETAEPYPLTEEKKGFDLDPVTFYRVEKMAFGKKDGKPDKSVIVYSGHLILRDIPLEAYDHVVNGKPAIEWIMERYAVTIDKASGIKNDPNGWSPDPRYIVELVKRIVRISVESARLVASLPPLNEDTA